MKPKLTLVVAVYNAVKYLEFIFTALKRQTTQEFEMVVADDGSGPEIRRLVDREKERATFPVVHLWQEDSGFRKNAMLNKSIEAARTDYLVFIDGDCVPHRQFLEDHLEQRQSNTALCGRRVNIGRRIVGRLTVNDIETGRLERFNLRLLLDGLLAGSSNLEDGVRIGNDRIRRVLHRGRARILGCNFSVEKKLLENINGFNEDYQAPGRGEDSDIAFRLELSGARLYPIRYSAIVYHLYHPATKEGRENKEIYESVVSSRNPVCRNGLKKLDAAPVHLVQTS